MCRPAAIWARVSIASRGDRAAQHRVDRAPRAGREIGRSGSSRGRGCSCSGTSGCADCASAHLRPSPPDAGADGSSRARASRSGEERAARAGCSQAPAEAPEAQLRRARPGLGPDGCAWIRDCGGCRHGPRHRALLRSGCEPRLDRRAGAGRSRGDRVGARLRCRAAAAGALRAVLVSARSCRSGDCRRVCHSRSRGGAVRPRAGRACAAARGRHRGHRHPGRAPLELTGHRRHRASRCRPRTGSPDTRHRDDVGVRRVRRDRSHRGGRCDRPARMA